VTLFFDLWSKISSLLGVEGGKRKGREGRYGMEMEGRSVFSRNNGNAC
jgi:hypothetical protein